MSWRYSTIMEEIDLEDESSDKESNDIYFIKGVKKFKAKQYKKSLSYFEKSLKKYGDSEQSLVFAATICYVGLEVTRNIEKAVGYFRRAALFDNDIAQYGLGLIYKYSDGVEQNYKTAIEWFILAAKLGHSAKHIEDIYCSVEPTQELDDAMFWYGIIMSVGNSDDEESIFLFNPEMDMLFDKIKEFEETNYSNPMANREKPPIILSSSPPNFFCLPRPKCKFMENLSRFWKKLRGGKKLILC